MAQDIIPHINKRTQNLIHLALGNRLVMLSEWQRKRGSKPSSGLDADIKEVSDLICTVDRWITIG